MDEKEDLLRSLLPLRPRLVLSPSAEVREDLRLERDGPPLDRGRLRRRRDLVKKEHT